MERYSDQHKKLFNIPWFGFHAEPAASAEGSVSIVIKKSILLWAFRLIRFFELSQYVKDNKNRTIVFNKIHRVEWFLTRQVQFGANIDYDGRNKSRDEYEKHWLELGYTPEMLKSDRTIEPSYAKPYHQHFFLEYPASSRECIPFWQPTRITKRS